MSKKKRGKACLMLGRIDRLKAFHQTLKPLCLIHKAMYAFGHRLRTCLYNFLHLSCLLSCVCGLKIFTHSLTHSLTISPTTHVVKPHIKPPALVLHYHSFQFNEFHQQNIPRCDPDYCPYVSVCTKCICLRGSGSFDYVFCLPYIHLLTFFGHRSFFSSKNT